MAMDHNAPPLRIDKSFIHVRANRLKLLQIALGTLTLLFTITCFPNEVFLFCTSRLHQFTQLFNAVCVNGFFLVLTSLLAAAYLCSVPDAYYQYNFILLEKFYTTLAVLMYAIGVFIVVGQIARVPFVFSWMLDLTLTSATFTAYLFDCVPRWRNGAEPVRTLA